MLFRKSPKRVKSSNLGTKSLKVRALLLSCVEQPLFVSPRLISIRMRTRAGYITVISAYAPTLLASDEDKDDFYQQLSDLLSSIPAGHDIALLGDFNARIGCYDVCES